MGDKAVQDFFLDKPDEFQLFESVREYIHSLGKASIKVTKSLIAFSNKRQFAWVWLPMKWDTRRPKDSIVLSFSLGRKIINSQIVQVVEPYPNRFMYHVIVEKESDVTSEVKKWLKYAFEFGNEKTSKN